MLYGLNPPNEKQKILGEDQELYMHVAPRQRVGGRGPHSTILGVPTAIATIAYSNSNGSASFQMGISSRYLSSASRERTADITPSAPG